MDLRNFIISPRDEGLTEVEIEDLMKIYRTKDKHVVGWDIKNNQKLYHPFKDRITFLDEFVKRIRCSECTKKSLKRIKWATPLNEYVSKKKRTTADNDVKVSSNNSI